MQEIVEQKESINTVIKYLNKFLFIIEFVLSIIFAICLFKLIYYKTYFDIYRAKDWIRIALTGIPLVSIIIYSLKNNFHCYEKLFLTFMIPIGILYLVYTLPGYVPDEDTHIYRTWSISQGNIFVSLEDQKEYIPTVLYDSNFRELRYDTLEEKIKTPTDYITLYEEGKFNTLFTYSPLMYLLPSLVFKIGYVFEINIMLLLYLARCANFILMLIAGYYTIKLIPIGKLVMMLYLFNPMYITEGISLAADGFINSTALLFVAYNINLLLKKDEITWKGKLLYFVLALCVSFNKHVYFPLVFIGILLLGCSKAFKKVKNKIFIVLCMIIMTVIAIGWFAYTGNYVEARPNVIVRNVNSSEQIKQIIEDPVKFLNVLKDTTITQNEYYIETLLGRKLGWLDINGSLFFTYILLFLILVAPFLEKNDEYEFTKLQKTFLILLSIGLYIAVLLALYASWTDVGEKVIKGVQGRYFIPFAILIPICFIKKGKYITFKYTNLVYLGFATGLNIFMLSKVITFLS